MRGEAVNLGTGEPAEGAPLLQVGQLVQQIATRLRDEFAAVRVEGEIADFSHYRGRHMYFKLKDEESLIQCAMFSTANRRLAFRPADGQRVIARGQVQAYTPRSSYQLIVSDMQETGVGKLLKQFEALKRKLKDEGLFDKKREGSIPRPPARIGLVGSRESAAARDVVTVLRNRFPPLPVVLFHTQVQGAGAAEQIIAALRAVVEHGERHEHEACDLVILARGGGDLEDLATFNNEQLARAIAAFPLPLICGVGHETDYTIADFVANLRAATPSQAAEIATPEAADWLRRVDRAERSIRQAIMSCLARNGKSLRQLRGRLDRAGPPVRLMQCGQRLDELHERLRAAAVRLPVSVAQALAALSRRLLANSPQGSTEKLRGRLGWLAPRLAAATRQRLDSASQRMRIAHSALRGLGPQNTLDRGYAIVTGADGKILADAAQAVKGSDIQARLARGTLLARVKARKIPSE
ncbi:MAG: exodeoxyribonuclease VII large subunit [Gammaproteobacteria bacterium]|nr:exodeoxyribonuclease VII large subunit [Gammaproteobacteria bacterium]